MKLSGRKKGFTLIELMLTATLMGIVTVGLYNLLNNGLYMWNYGTARMALDSEARMTMLMIKKIVQVSQGSTISISRLNTSSPVNSYLSCLAGETIFVSSNRVKCGCGMSNDIETVGVKGAPVEIYQDRNYIVASFPQVKPGTDMTDSTAVSNNTKYTSITITANADSLEFAFIDSPEGTKISTAVRLSKLVMNDRPILTVFLKDIAVVKHMNSAGYYNN
ncbi:MAG: prepilin-type N-terminal cleavage/methylation domain-containing protein [Spirochaetia bacterium]|nr:prepilin-type N-terminal cleavage/methylation domain-containing protein [Spirochaetia bacterium]